MNEFFTLEREHFFQPLTSKYRAQIVECLVLLYQRLYSASQADYGHALVRDQVLEIFQEAIVRAPELASAELEEGRFANSRDQAVWVFNQLIEHGWLEKQLDSANLRSTYSYSRYGRLFTEPFTAQAQLTAHTRHRNTRNTRNALQAFLERGDIYDLLDAYDYSERIVSDFSDIISELDERKRDLMREMEGQLLVQYASEAFFDFMENRFQPDIAIRLSADNVEKHRDVINQLIKQIRKKDKTFKATAERRLREQLPELSQRKDSLLWYLLDGIEQRVRNAAEIMLPALRKALQNFTKRADIIIRQLSYLAGQQHNNVVAVCQHLAQLTPEQQQHKLTQAGARLAVPKIELLDPASVKLAVPKERVITHLGVDEGGQAVSQEARRELYIQQMLDQAFLINQVELKGYLLRHLRLGAVLSSRDLPIQHANELLAVANVISLGSQETLSSEFSLHIQPDERDEQQSAALPYFIKKDHFLFSLVARAET